MKIRETFVFNHFGTFTLLKVLPLEKYLYYVDTDCQRKYSGFVVGATHLYLCMCANEHILS